MHTIAASLSFLLALISSSIETSSAGTIHGSGLRRRATAATQTVELTPAVGMLELLSDLDNFYHTSDEASACTVYGDAPDFPLNIKCEGVYPDILHASVNITFTSTPPHVVVPSELQFTDLQDFVASFEFDATGRPTSCSVADEYDKPDTSCEPCAPTKEGYFLAARTNSLVLTNGQAEYINLFRPRTRG